MGVTSATHVLDCSFFSTAPIPNMKSFLEIFDQVFIKSLKRYETVGSASKKTNARKISGLERIFVTSGSVIQNDFKPWMYRIKDVMCVEFAPPKASEWPLVKHEIRRSVDCLLTGGWKEYNLKRIFSNFLVAMDAILLFFIGETIGKGNISGYLIPGAFEPKRHKEDPYGDFLRKLWFTNIFK